MKTEMGIIGYSVWKKHKDERWDYCGFFEKKDEAEQVAQDAATKGCEVKLNTVEYSRWD